MSSGVCAAMRDRRLLSARGHPDRLKGEEKRNRERRERAKDRKKKRRTKKGGEEASERRGEKEVSEGKSRMQGIPRSFRKKRTDGKK